MLPRRLLFTVERNNPVSSFPFCNDLSIVTTVREHLYYYLLTSCILVRLVCHEMVRMSNKRYDPVDVLAYIWEIYNPTSSDGSERFTAHDHFSLSRATKLIYLVDWRHVLEFDRQATRILWYFDHFGPYVDLTDNLNKLFDISYETKGEGSYKRTRRTLSLPSPPKSDPRNLDSSVRKICEEVVEKTKSMGYLQFMRYIYQTVPVRVSEKYSTMELEKIAKSINRTKRDYILKH